MAHLWSGRFAGDPDAELFAFGSSFRFDKRLFEDDVTGSLAWAGALARAGVLSETDASAIDRGLRALLARAAGDPGFVTDAHGDEDVHAFVERELVALVGDAGRRLHTGRSRNEQVAVDLRLYLKRRVPEIQRTIAGTVLALVDLAGRAGHALMPSYTHLRRAQPVLISHFLLSHCAALRRDVDRLTAGCRGRRAAARLRGDRGHGLRSTSSGSPRARLRASRATAWTSAAIAFRRRLQPARARRSGWSI